MLQPKKGLSLAYLQAGSMKSLWRSIISVSCNNFTLKHLSPVLSLSATIQVLNGRNGTFKAICTSYGGQPLSMSITGPSGVEQDLMNKSIGKTWNACVFVIESPRGRSAKRPRHVAPRYLSRSAPQGLSITNTHKHSTSYVYT